MDSTKEVLSKILCELIEEHQNSDEWKTPKQQAKEMEIPYQTFLNYVKGRSECSARNLAILAEYYHVSTDYLLGRSKAKTKNENIKMIEKATGLSQDAIYHLIALNKYIRKKKSPQNMSLFQKDMAVEEAWRIDFTHVIDAVILSIQPNYLESICKYFTVKAKRKIYNDVLLQRFCADRGIVCHDGEIEQYGESIFHKRKLQSAYQLLDDYQEFKKLVSGLYKHLKASGDEDIALDFDVLKYRVSNYYENECLFRVGQHLDRTLYTAIFQKEFKGMYSRLINEYIDDNLNFLIALQKEKNRKKR